MNQTFPCPVCSSSAWVDRQTFIYCSDDHAKGRYSRLEAVARIVRRLCSLLVLRRLQRRPFRSRNLTRYQKARRRVLFERWLPQAQEVTLTAMSCAGCGFMAYAPRPERKDLDAKYEHLHAIASEPSYARFAAPADMGLDHLRAQRLADAVRPWCPQRRMRVLDYGGGDGKLMRPFLEAGHECFVLDYSKGQIPGVVRLGSSLEELKSEERFDLIVASHVLEHVVQPREDLGRLREHLADDGIIYCEVPSEIVGGLWIDNDPVTHINFFTFGSFNRLLREAGLRIHAGARQIGSYGNHFRDIIWAVASRRADAVDIEPKPDVDEYLHPRRREILLLLATLLWRNLKARLKK